MAKTLIGGTVTVAAANLIFSLRQGGDGRIWQVVTVLGDKEEDFAAATRQSADGLLMTPRRTGTDGFFVSVLKRRAWPLVVIARRPCAEAIQPLAQKSVDCFAEPVIGPRFARTRWLAMTVVRRPFGVASPAAVAYFPHHDRSTAHQRRAHLGGLCA
jgi:hypothetical protein